MTFTSLPVLLPGAVVVPFVMLITNFLSRWTTLGMTNKDIGLIAGWGSGFGLLNNHRCTAVATLIDDSILVAAKLRREGVECICLNFYQQEITDYCVQVV